MASTVHQVTLDAATELPGDAPPYGMRLLSEIEKRTPPRARTDDPLAATAGCRAAPLETA